MNKDEIGKDLRTRRVALGLRQVEVAKVGGLQISRLSLIENCWVRPRSDEITRIQKAIDELSKR